MLNLTPLVSIGIPTYNRPNGLVVALNSIISQTYKNLEIIVADNCSPTNESETIVNEIKKNDVRISYIKHDKNIGAINNFEFVLQKATGKYFMWAADDDSWDSNFIYECISKLESDSKYICCGTWAVLVYNEHCKKKYPISSFENKYNFLRVYRYTKCLMSTNIWFYSIYKRDSILKIKIDEKVASDQTFFLQIVNMGRVKILPYEYFYYSMSGISSSPLPEGKSYNYSHEFLSNNYKEINKYNNAGFFNKIFVLLFYTLGILTSWRLIYSIYTAAKIKTFEKHFKNKDYLILSYYRIFKKIFKKIYYLI